MSADDRWSAVDQYIADLFAPHDEALAETLVRSDAAGLPAISVSAAQGKLLYLLARALRVSSILEIGTLGAYSTIWLARGLEPGGRVITLEANDHHADIAEENLRQAGLASVVDVRRGRALDTLPALRDEGLGPFDMIFIDADKPGYPDYLTWALTLSRVGTVIIADNLVRDGAVIDADSTDVNVIAVRRFNAMIAREPRVSTTVIQTVGSKGYDGFGVAVVLR